MYNIKHNPYSLFAVRQTRSKWFKINLSWVSWQLVTWCLYLLGFHLSMQTSPRHMPRSARPSTPTNHDEHHRGMCYLQIDKIVILTKNSIHTTCLFRGSSEQSLTVILFDPQIAYQQSSRLWGHKKHRHTIYGVRIFPTVAFSAVYQSNLDCTTDTVLDIRCMYNHSG